MKSKKIGAAKALFFAGFTIEEIAQTLRIAKGTVSKASTEQNWVAMRTKQNLLEENTHTKLMNVFAFQVECLDKMVEERRAKKEFTAFKAGDFDGLQKMFSTIKTDWRKFQVYAVIVKEFVEYIQSMDLEVGKSAAEIGKQFLYEKNKVI